MRESPAILFLTDALLKQRPFLTDILLVAPSSQDPNHAPTGHRRLPLRSLSLFQLSSSTSAPALRNSTAMDSLLLQHDRHSICDVADSETNVAQKVTAKDVRLTVKSNDLAKILDQMKISKTPNRAGSEGEETSMWTFIDYGTETILRAKSYTYPKQPSNVSRFAFRKGSTAITPRALTTRASKILRRPGQRAQRAQLDDERRARSQAFRPEMHLFIADAEVDRAALSGMTDGQLARMLEELLTSAGVTRKPTVVPLLLKATAGDGLGDLSEKLEVCSRGEPAAQDQSTRS